MFNSQLYDEKYVVNNETTKYVKKFTHNIGNKAVYLGRI
jgi:hypothetical protein